MATRKGLNKVLESSKTHWQSTPSATRTHAPTKDTFEDKMPFTNPLSPVLQEDQLSSEGKKYDARKHSTLEMIAKAIEGLGGGKKGSSIQAIKKWILGNYIGIEPQPLNLRIRKALVKGLETEVLGRGNKSAQMTGARGFFIVKPKTKTANKKVKKDPKIIPAAKNDGDSRKGKRKAGHVSDSEVTIIKPDRRKSAKLHVSDTDLSPENTILQMKTKPKKIVATVAKTDSKKEKKSEKAKSGKKPEKVKGEKKLEKKTSRNKDVPKADDEEKKVEKQSKVKADLAIASTSKEKKTTAEKLEAKIKEKPAKKAAVKPKKVDADANKEQSTLNKRNARNK